MVLPLRPSDADRRSGIRFHARAHELPDLAATRIAISVRPLGALAQSFASCRLSTAQR
jgi:hypothetical protein